MKDSETASAIELARQAVGAAADDPAEPMVVRRLDTAAEYVLVRLGPSGGPGWIAAVDPAARDVMSWAVNSSGGSTVPTVAGAAPDYVWVPSSVSPSPLYPLLRLSTDDGPRFVDITGTIHDHLTGHRG